MDLEVQQRALLQLIKGQPLPAHVKNDYLQYIAKSPYLELTREIVQWWKSYRIERFCPLTSELLRQLDLFDKETWAFEPRQANHHYIENVGLEFLKHMSHHDSALVAAVAQFEYALIKVNLGDETDYVIHWTQNPAPVVNALIMQTPLPEPGETGRYKIHVSKDLEQTFEII